MEKEVQKMENKKEISTKVADYLVSEENKLSRMYHVVKTHKIPCNDVVSVPEVREWLTAEGWPTREIISGSGSSTERISSLVNHLLSPGMQNLQSYIKDTKHLLQLTHYLNEELEAGNMDLENMAFLTLDVKALYPSMPKTLGREACKKFLDKRQDSTISSKSIMALLDLCLDHNVFEFNQKTYIQSEGVPIGPCMAPPYACLGMGEFETQAFEDPNFIQTFQSKLLFWKRFIDDILTLFRGSRGEAEQFVNFLNSLFPGVIEFTFDFSTAKIVFLDVELSFKHGKIETSLHIKPTNLQMYLDWNSNHPFHCKVAIIYSQALRVHLICSDPLDRQTFLDSLRDKFIKSNYPDNHIKEQFE